VPRIRSQRISAFSTFLEVGRQPAPSSRASAGDRKSPRNKKPPDRSDREAEFNIQNQNTAPQAAAQVFDRERARRKYGWLTEVKRELRSDHGREVCKQCNVAPHFVAALADDISRIPSFRERGEVWIGQQRIRVGLGVTDRQVRRGLRTLKALNLLRVKRRGRGLTNTMAALHGGRPLFPDNVATGSFTDGNGTRMSSEDRTVASSNLIGEETQEYSSPIGHSKATPGKRKRRRRRTAMSTS
jgi:hypothetical protein